jgi:hypothetical protein
VLALENYGELESLLADLRQNKSRIVDLSLQEADLEQVFLRIMSHVA